MGDISNADNKKLLEDFRIKNAEKLKKDHVFKRRLASRFDSAWKAHLEDTAETVMNWELYRNKVPIDYFNQADTDKEKKHLYSSATPSRICDRFVSILISRDLEPNANIRVNENFKEIFMALIKEGKISDDTITWANDFGAFVFDEQGVITGIDPDGLKSWLVQLSKYAFKTLLNDTDINFSVKKEIAVRAACMSKSSWVKLRTGKRFGKKAIFLENVPSTNVCQDPEATTRDGREEIFQVMPMELSRAAKEYGLNLDKLKPSPVQSDMYKITRNSNGDEEISYSRPMVLVVEAHIKDETEFEGAQVYPTGRVITFIDDQGELSEGGILIVRDRPNEYADCQLQDMILKPETETSGKPLIRDLIYIGNLLDSLIQQVILNYKMTGSPKVIYESGALVKPENVTNRVADKIEVTHMAGVDFHGGIPMDNSALGLAGFLKSDTRDISGVQEASEGVNPSDVRSGSALQILKTQVDRLFGPASKNIEVWFNRVFRILGPVVLAYFKEGDVIRYGDNHAESYTLEFDFSMLFDAFEFYLAPGAMMPRDELSYVNMLMSLAQTQAPDGRPYVSREFLLKELKIDKAEEIQKEIDDRMQIEQQLQQLQEQLQQFAQQGQQMQKEFEAVSQERDTLKNKMMANDTSHQMKIYLQQMKDEQTNYRNMLDGKFKLMQQEMKDQTAVLVKQLEITAQGVKEKPART